MRLRKPRTLLWFGDHSRIVVLIFFLTLLAVGIGVYRDFGISWDEPFQREYGRAVYDYISSGDLRMFEGPNKYYGPVFEVTLVAIERILGLEDSRDIYMMRHLATFLVFFCGSFFFYKLCTHLFGSWRTGLLGSLFLVLSPRIFAHGFCNSKDLPVLSLFVVSMYTLVIYLDKKTILRGLVHALACALLVDIRLVGTLVPAFTLGFTIFDLTRAGMGPQHRRRAISSLIVYLVTLAALVLVFWPTLWEGPVYHFMKAFEEMRRYPYENTLLYLGRYTWASNLPWHYTSVWMLISTPVVFIGLFAVGCVASLRSLLSRRGGLPVIRRNVLLLLLWFFFPLIYLPLSGAVVFDGLRHTLFLYPALLAISLVGLKALFDTVKRRFRPSAFKGLCVVLTAAVVLNLAAVFSFMVRSHPYEIVYFNEIIGGVRGAKDRFELDYWGLSYKEALEYIVEYDDDDVIRFFATSRPGKSNVDIMTVEDRTRLEFVLDPYRAKYVLSGQRWQKLDYPPEREIYSIEIDGVKIMVVVEVARRGSVLLNLLRSRPRLNGLS
jgi:hypothetical protein